MDYQINHDATAEEAFENRSRVEIERDCSESINVHGTSVGKITKYTYNILVHDHAPLSGSLTREEVETLFRLYSSEGAGLSQRSVARHFPQFTFQEFKKILKAFKITKASAPFPPHVIEERSIDDLVTLTMQNKESDYLRKFEQERNRLTEVKLKEMTKNYYELKQQSLDFKDFLSSLKFDVEIKLNKPAVSAQKAIIVYLSDMHIGAAVSRDSIYDNEFNAEVAKQRLEIVLAKVVQLSKTTGCKEIIVCNVGDALDGYNGETTRGGHGLPQNMNNKSQFENYLNLMIGFFKAISDTKLFQNIRFYSVEGGNHDGDIGYQANRALGFALSAINPQMEVEVFTKYMGHFSAGEHTFVLCHGKDSKDVFKNMPLTLNDKTENQINEYLDSRNLKGKIHFIKGDLHQTATTYGSRFRYKSVASFFGSSEWIHKNFGNTKAAVDIDIVDGDVVLETRTVLN